MYQSSYLMILSNQMAYANIICQYERKYAMLNKNICHFLNRNRACFPKKSKARKHVQIDAMLSSGFLIQKTRSVMVPRFGFFPRFTDSRKMTVHRLMQRPLYSLKAHILWRKKYTFYAFWVSYSDGLDHTACENE